MTGRSSKSAALVRLAALRQKTHDADRALQEAKTEFDRSARWFDQAEGRLRDYYNDVAADRREESADLERELRAEVDKLRITRVFRDRRGDVVRYYDSRAKQRLDDADAAKQLASMDEAMFIDEHRDELAADMVTRSLDAASDLNTALDEASAAWTRWYRVRAEWLPLIERWGIAPAELRVLPGADPLVALQTAEVDRQRAGGAPANDPDQRIPAPISILAARHEPQPEGLLATARKAVTAVSSFRPLDERTQA